jgi:glucose/arabinose dehydrogenase
MKLVSIIIALGFGSVWAAEPKESDYFKITAFDIPKGEVIEATGFAVMDDGKVAVCSRRGQIWTVANVDLYPAKPAKWTLFAEYIHEPLGLAYNDGWLYATQRPEVTRMKDTDGDGRADKFETVSDDWGISGDYHEYAFGSRFDKDGNIWTTLCLTGSYTAEALYRGWIMKINKDGTAVPAACGVRSPGGIGLNIEGDVFYTDNQGTWNGSSSLKWVKPGSFLGNPNGNVFFKHTKGVIGERPPEPEYDGGSNPVEARKRIPTYVPPAVVLPHGKVGQSPTAIETDISEGKFGPFAGQTFIAEQTHSQVQRVFLEKVNGMYQGAVFHFLKGFSSGNIGLMITKDGQMYTGGSNRGWGAWGTSLDSFERVNWTGKTPFEIHEMRAQSDGFELTFTKPADITSLKASAFKCSAYTYKYSKGYGSPELNQITPKIEIVSIGSDGKSVKLKLSPLTKGHVHELSASGVRSKDGTKLLHDTGYYTLNEIPK